MPEEYTVQKKNVYAVQNNRGEIVAISDFNEDLRTPVLYGTEKLDFESVGILLDKITHNFKDAGRKEDTKTGE